MDMECLITLDDAGAALHAQLKALSRRFAALISSCLYQLWYGSKIYTPTSTGEGTFSVATVYGKWPGGEYLAVVGVTTAVPKPEIVCHAPINSMPPPRRGFD